MDESLLKPIATVLFFIVILFFAVISLMAIYVFIRYGRNRSLTLMTSLIFAGIFLLGTLTAFVSLMRIF